MITAKQIKIPQNNFCSFQIPEPKNPQKWKKRINKTTTSCDDDDDDGSCGSNGGVHRTMTHNAGSKFDSFSRFRLSRRKGKRKRLGGRATTYDSGRRQRLGRHRRDGTIQPTTIGCHSKEIRPIRPCGGRQPSWGDCGTFWCGSFSTF